MREPESVYFNSDKFLEDMRSGTLRVRTTRKLACLL